MTKGPESLNRAAKKKHAHHSDFAVIRRCYFSPLLEGTVVGGLKATIIIHSYPTITIIFHNARKSVCVCGVKHRVVGVTDAIYSSTDGCHQHRGLEYHHAKDGYLGHVHTEPGLPESGNIFGSGTFFYRVHTEPCQEKSASTRKRWSGAEWLNPL